MTYEMIIRNKELDYLSESNSCKKRSKLRQRRFKERCKNVIWTEKG